MTDSQTRVCAEEGSDAEMLPKIFVFVNGGAGTGMVSMTALSQDGEFLAGHLCSNERWGWHDMGMSSDWKHEHYRERYPGGFVLVWVEGDARRHAGLMAAYAKHIAAGELGTEWQRSRAIAAETKGGEES